MGKVVLPGETLSDFKESEKTYKVILGPGLRQEADDIIVSKPGIVRFKEPNVYWVDSNQKRVRVFIVFKGDNSGYCINMLQ